MVFGGQPMDTMRWIILRGIPSMGGAWHAGIGWFQALRA